jgi:hypothetical protein
MSIKKSLLTLAVLALAMMGLASSAMASGGVVRDVKTNELIPVGRELHLVGWAKFENGLGGFECHVTSIIKTTANEVTGVNEGNTAHVTTFTVPDTTKCKGSGFVGPCELETHNSTTTGAKNEETWDVTATKEDFDVKPFHGATVLTIHEKFKTNAFCAFSGEEITLTFSEITLTPLKTGKREVTNTANTLGETAKPGEEIAGVKISGKGTLDTANGGKDEIEATGELELTEADRCTWKLT